MDSDSKKDNNNHDESDVKDTAKDTSVDSSKNNAPKDDSKDDSKDTSKENNSSSGSQQAPADALSKTPEELEEERTEQAMGDTDLDSLDPQEKKVSGLRKFLRKVNVYFLLFILLLVVAGVIAAVNYFSSIQEPTEASINSQSLSTDALKQLSNTDTSVGTSSQTLTIQGNAIISGQTLARGSLSVAGNIQAGGSIEAPNIVISGSANLPSTQASSLQVANGLVIQGDTSLSNLTVSGTSSFSGTVTMSDITVSHLTLSGNAVLEVPNHIRFSGGTPSRTILGDVLGSGGSASISGSDTAGTVNINSGNSPSSGCFVRITFQQSFSSQPHVIISPVNEAAGKMDYYVIRDTTNFQICSANTITANKSFGFDYLVTY